MPKTVPVTVKLDTIELQIFMNEVKEELLRLRKENAELEARIEMLVKRIEILEDK